MYADVIKKYSYKLTRWRRVYPNFFDVINLGERYKRKFITFHASHYSLSDLNSYHRRHNLFKFQVHKRHLSKIMSKIISYQESVDR